MSELSFSVKTHNENNPSKITQNLGGIGVEYNYSLQRTIALPQNATSVSGTP